MDLNGVEEFLDRAHSTAAEQRPKGRAALVEFAKFKSRMDSHKIVDGEQRDNINSQANVLEVLFAPYLANVWKRSHTINVCSIERFKKKMGITSNILEPMQDLWATGMRFTLAGGKMIDFVLNKNMSDSNSDYDAFFTDLGAPIYMKRLLLKQKYVEAAQLTYLSEWTSVHGNKYHPIKLQVTNTTYANTEDVIESFDIRACAIACDGKNVYWVKGALQDIFKKQIVMLNPRVDTHAMYRIVKYIKKGYEIAVPDLVIASIRLLDSLYGPLNPDRQDQILNRNFEFNRANALAYRDMVEAREEAMGRQRIM